MTTVLILDDLIAASSPAYVARAIGVTTSSVRHWRNGGRDPHPYSRKRLERLHQHLAGTTDRQDVAA